MRWTAAELAEITRGTLHADPDTVIESVTTDSREVRPGAAFVAIVGEQFDGSAFSAQAAAAGAVVMIVPHMVSEPCIVVHDTTHALGLIARAHLRALPRTTVVAITGSSGKTSTKDLVAQVLSSAAPTVAPTGSFNNEIGLPRTVLEADDHTRFLVLEMGMRGGGQIARLCDIAPPDIATVLNIGSAHAGVIGTRDDTAAGKGEIIRALHADGVAVINRDDAYAGYFSGLAACPTLDFGFDEGFVHASDIVLDDLARASFTLHIGADSAPVSLQLLGEHHAGNALAAAAIAHALVRQVGHRFAAGKDRAAIFRSKVGPGAKGAVTGPGEDHRTNAVVRIGAVHRVVDLVHHRPGEGVHLLRPVERQGGDAFANVKVDLRIAHMSLPGRVRPGANQ